MDLSEEGLEQVTALSVKGGIDKTKAAQFGQEVELVVAAPSGRLAIDFRHHDYIGSAGFRVLLVAAKRTGATGSLPVRCGLLSKLRELFDFGGFPELFSITATRAAAIGAAR